MVETNTVVMLKTEGWPETQDVPAKSDESSDEQSGQFYLYSKKSQVR